MSNSPGATESIQNIFQRLMIAGWLLNSDE